MMSKLSDSEIEQWVLTELGLSEAIQSREICVLCDNGVVTLKGTVNRFDNKLAASHAARIAEGVVGVVNKIRVMPPGALISWRAVSRRRAVRGRPGLFAKVESIPH